ncbi:type II toxin-antitoxin system Phd/YefM family antitoxin [Sediminibacterium sp.]|jgi:antitoxin YefM|uniref:type II toxin-antitoxin system Phd/YefM family antitoxin n=1 Tax=Sediminibacterium sp. TaxID=1917865 RepID=UPI002715D219|nr:type II toxin-antitoxin system prevent-host-death family antitoxin [Sediminibacterium sp.]MBA4259782.1 type II toxin-antitoxin system prevent-host-death family antitoxin [Chitinophaga sp.]MDO9155483.1 type II toxin-antitoxin system prevent-host-death family antitoxin [Sediminibacterium sp.]MDP1971424.1 type II toxin-antitoxin system prevent-host-death family antitoxin [Sediminibacterium sp.]MDP2422487.1 type II toxin-antitoxin system prevent-host-death family antitoxin [Sediminibacterium sp.
MKVVNYTEFRNNLAESLNSVNDDGDIVVVARSKGKNVVVMSLEEYNSIQETIYLNSTPANRARLETALARIETTKPLQKKLINK